MALENVAGAKERVEAVAKNILKHYLYRTVNLEGKAMIVYMRHSK